MVEQAVYRLQVPVSIYEDSASLHVRAVLPGAERDKIHVEYLEGQLHLRAQRTEGEGDAAETIQFQRSVLLPSEVQSSAITAKYENGILTVTLPKQAETTPQKVAVTVQ
jgi:HSP20 family protein